MLTTARSLFCRAPGARSSRMLPRIFTSRAPVRAMSLIPENQSEDEWIQQNIKKSSKWKAAVSEGVEDDQDDLDEEKDEADQERPSVSGGGDDGSIDHDWRIPPIVDSDEYALTDKQEAALEEIEALYGEKLARAGVSGIDHTYSTVRWLESSADGSNVAWSSQATLHQGKPLLVRYDYRAASKTMTKEALASRPQTMWRYHELLPIPDPDDIISLGEVVTPLIEMHKLSERVGLHSGAVLLKDDSRCPTGSTKARGMAVAVSMAKGHQHPTLTIASSGTDAQTLASYATRARIPSNTWVAAESSNSNQFLSQVAGALSFVTEGTYADNLAIVQKGRHILNWFNMTAFHEPYRLEGDKTIIFEIAEQLGWDVPDVIIVPLATGASLVGIYKGLEELREVGLLPKDVVFPRLVGVQSDRCPVLSDAFLRAEVDVKHHYPRTNTLLHELNMPYTNASDLVLKYTRATNGMIFPAKDEDVADYAGFVGMAEGIVVSPESAACFGALKALVDSEWVKPNEVVVVLNSSVPEKQMEFWKQKTGGPLAMDYRNLNWFAMKSGSIGPNQDPFAWETKDRFLEKEAVKEFDRQYGKLHGLNDEDAQDEEPTEPEH